MNPHSMRIVPKGDNVRAILSGPLAHLSDVDDDYTIADTVPDFRGWIVTLPDGRRVGVADDIVFDTSAMTAKYVEVRVDPDALLSDEESWVLVPVESVRADREKTWVVIDHVPAGGLAHAPRHRGDIPTVEEEGAVLAYFTATAVGSNLG